MPSSPRRIKAAAILQSLNNLDLHLQERADLRAAGVPESTIQSLYPEDMEGLSEAVLEHLRGRDVSHLWDTHVNVTNFLQSINRSISRLSPELIEEFRASIPRSRAGHGNQALRTHLWQQLGASRAAIQVADNFTGYLLRSWWFSTHRAQLPQHLQVNADLRLGWIYANLLTELHLPEVAVAHA